MKNEQVWSLRKTGCFFKGYAGVRAGVGKWAFRSEHAQSACACLPTPRMLECIVSGKRVTQWQTAYQKRKNLWESTERPQACQCPLMGPRVLLWILWWITHDIQLPAAHHHDWVIVGCQARSLMHSSVKYSRAVTFYHRHEYSVHLIRELGAVRVDPALPARSHGCFLLQLKSIRFINWDYACHR